jgi:phosphate:Na+ symporter
MARVLTFDLSWLSPLLIFIGVIFFWGVNKRAKANWGVSVLALG